MQKISLIKEKILEYIDFIGISKYQFYQKTGITRGVLDKDTGISEENIAKFIAYYPEINLDWLLTGKGNRIKSAVQNNDFGSPKDSKPFFNLPVSAGRSLFDVMGVNKPDGFIYNLPGMASTENLLPVVGYSMEPDVKENAIIGVRKMDQWETLNTTKKYLIITKDDRMIKYIEHDENNNDILWCVSPNFKRFKIYKTDIIEIQRVTFVINPE